MARDPESQLSFDVRANFALLDCVTVQVVEAGAPGPADLIIEDDSHHWFWLELKCRAPLRAEQRIFLRRRWYLNFNAFLLKRYLNRYNEVVKHSLWRGCNPLQAEQEVWTGADLDCKAIYREMLLYR